MKDCRQNEFSFRAFYNSLSDRGTKGICFTSATVGHNLSNLVAAVVLSGQGHRCTVASSVRGDLEEGLRATGFRYTGSPEYRDEIGWHLELR